MSRVQQAPLLGAVALVTGAGAGIGQAVAVELARRGAATIIIADLTTSKLTKTAEQIRRYGVDAVPVALDVTDRTGLEDLAHLIGQRYGAVDILVNNAGIGMAGRLRDTSSTDWDRILAVNLRSVIDATTIFGSQMAARGRGGYVLNLASAAAFLPSKAMVAYTTTKGAVLAFTESARADLADARIQVSAVCPGFVNTDIAATTIYAGATAEQQQRSRARAARAYRFRNYTPQKAARAIADAIGKDKPIVLIGLEARAGRVAYRFAPTFVRLIARLDVRP